MKNFIWDRFRRIITCMLIIMLLPINGSFIVKAEDESGQIIIDEDGETEDSEEEEEEEEAEEPDEEELEEEEGEAEAQEPDEEELKEEFAAEEEQTEILLMSPMVFLGMSDSEASTELELQEAVSQAPMNGVLYTIEIIGEIELLMPLEIENGQNILIYSDKTVPETIISENKRHFKVEGSLTLEHIIIDGKDSGGGIEVQQGKVILNEGAVITNCKVTTNEGGGGIIISQGYLAVNEGALITNCDSQNYGGGVAAEGSIIDINGGSVIGNKARFGAGIYAKNESTINLVKGKINDNRIKSDGNSGVGVNINGGDSIFTMLGGEITGNGVDGNGASVAGGGVVVTGARFNLINGVIAGNHATHGGAGVAVSGGGHFEMTGGTISGNTASTNSNYITVGGGVDVQYGSFTMSSGTIEGNEADIGGGVHVGYGNLINEFNFNGGTVRANTADYGGGIMGQYSNSTINLNGGTVGGENSEDANTAHTGGGIYLLQATANMSKGSIMGNTAASIGGGVYIEKANFNLSGGAVTENSAPIGGGIYMYGNNAPTVLNITGGEISRNTAAGSLGGGIYIFDAVTASISNALIKANAAETEGGGIYINGNTILPVKNTEFSGNSAKTNGGGVYLHSAGTIEANEKVSFINNEAGNEGGAIYTEKFIYYLETMDKGSDYTNIITADDTVFSANTADNLYEPPVNAKDFMNLRFARTSVEGSEAHLLNNYDINYVFGGEIKAHLVIYNANDESANPKTVQYYVKEGGSHTVKADNDNEINFIRKGHVFTGWNTEANGNGTEYKSTDEITDINENIALYAQWKKTVNPGPGPGPGPEPEPEEKDREDKEPPYVPVKEPEPEFLLNKEDHFAYIVGYPDDTVRPDANITRAETATIFFRLLTETARNTYLVKTNYFTDVESGDWYNVAVSTMTNAQILAGYTDGSFGGNNYITRAEFAAIAARFDSGSYHGEDKFSDISGHWAAEEINRAAEKGWIEGYGDGTFRPNQQITRAEAVTLVNHVLERDKNKELHPDMITWIDNVIGQWYYLDIQEATNSHIYHRDDSDYEIWDEITEIPNWMELEKSR